MNSVKNVGPQVESALRRKNGDVAEQQTSGRECGKDAVRLRTFEHTLSVVGANVRFAGEGT